MDNLDYRNMVDDLLEEVSGGLSEWEINFLSNMKCHAGEYSPKQKTKIEAIWIKMLGQ